MKGGGVMFDLLPEASQIVEFDVMSIIFTAIILIAFIVGVVKGLIGAIVSFLSSIGSIFFASLLSEPVGNALYGTDFSRIVYTPIFSWVSSQGDGMLNQTITPETKDLVLDKAFELLNIPDIFKVPLGEAISSLIPTEGINLAEVLSESLTLYAMTAISFVVLAIVIFLLFFLLKKFAKKFNEIPVIGGVNRLLGGIVGLGIGITVCSLICFALSFLSTLNVSFALDLITSMRVGDDTIWTLSKTIYNNNFILSFISF